MLYIGAFLAFFIGVIHSYLGEKFILIRLFRRDNLPELLGSDWFTKRVLRFAWHLTTLAWWGFAAILYAYAANIEVSRIETLQIIGVTFLLSGLLSFGFTNGKHISWVVFFSISGICLYTAAHS